MQILITAILLLLMLVTLGILKMNYYKEVHIQSLITSELFLNQIGDIQSGFKDVYEKCSESSRKMHETVIKKPEKEKKERPRRVKKEEQKRLSRVLNIGSLLDQNATEKTREATKLLFCRLLDALYREEPFYKAALQHCPDLNNHLVECIIERLKELKKEPGKSKVTLKAIHKLQLDDSFLNDVLYRMLSGMKELNGEQKIHCYYALSDFIQTSEQEQISIWLVPKPILFAIFQDQKIVDDICQERQKLLPLVGKKLSQEEAKKEFEGMFKPLVPEEMRSLTLSFAVTTTAPRG